MTIEATEQVNLLEHELAQRWRITIKTLQRWRYCGCGPDFIKVGTRVIYPLRIVEAFEIQHLQAMGLPLAGNRT